MTTPGIEAPDGAYVIGDPDYGQGMTQEKMEQQVTAQTRADLETAVTGFTNHKDRIGATRANWYDGQNAYQNRLDLLEDVRGFGSSFMGFNWDVPENTWVVVPYERQLGPAKRLEVTPEGELVLKAGGLWRVDALSCATGYSIGMEIYNVNGVPVTYTYYNPVVLSNMIEVVAPDGSVFTAKYYTNTTGAPVNSFSMQGVDSPFTYSFNHTFVLPDVDEDDPATWYRVRLSAKWNGIYRGLVSGAWCRLHGGTAKTALTATRWSSDVENVNYLDSAPDGGVVPS